MKTLPVLFLTTLLLFVPRLPAAEPVSFQVGEFTFERPDGWQWIHPSSPMRKAELAVPGKPEAAEITFFHFGPGQGGSVDANLQRWLSQFSESLEDLDAKRAEQETPTTTVHMIQARGTFLSGMPGETPVPKDDFALRGAILESEDGDVYVKMTGPRDVVIEASDAFDMMVLKAGGVE